MKPMLHFFLLPPFPFHLFCIPFAAFSAGLVSVAVSSAVPFPVGLFPVTASFPCPFLH
jgi:hypothetical protein